MDLKPGFLPLESYIQLPRDSHTYLIKSLIPSGGIALIYGQEKSGKSAIAVQLAAALSGGSNTWMGFPVTQHGKVLYLQLDNPRSTWIERFQLLKQHGLKYVSDNLCLADRDSIEPYPFDILDKGHMAYLRNMIWNYHKGVVAVIVDTLRESHSGESNEDTVMRNVIANLQAVASPASLIMISHARKPHPDAKQDLMADHRGSSYTTGRADAIIRLTHNKMYYGGRSIETGVLKLSRREFPGYKGDTVLMFEPAVDSTAPALKKVLADPTLTSLRAKARALAEETGCSEDSAMYRLRREQEEIESVDSAPDEQTAKSEADGEAHD